MYSIDWVQCILVHVTMRVLFVYTVQVVEECVNILANRLYNGGRIKDKCESAGVY